MFKATNDAYKSRKSTIGEYLVRLGLALSDLIEIDGILVTRSSFWNKIGFNDMHGMYSLGDDENQGLIVHVQAYPTLSSDSTNPLICAWLKEMPRLSDNREERTHDTRVIKRLLEQRL